MWQISPFWVSIEGGVPSDDLCVAGCHRLRSQEIPPDEKLRSAHKPCGSCQDSVSNRHFFPINSKHILNFKKHDQKCASSWDYHGIELIHHRLISFPSWLFMTFLTWILQFPGPPGPGPNVHSPHRCHARAQTPGRRQSSRPPGSGTMEFTWTIWEAYGIWMHMGLSWNGGTPIAGWFIMENSIKMIVDDLVALF